MYAEVQLLSHFRQQVSVSFPVATEVMIVAHRDGAGSHGADQDRFDVFTRGEAAEVLGKRKDQGDIYTHGLEELQALVDDGQKQRRLPPCQCAGMILEGDDAGRATEAPGFLHRPADHLLVTGVDAVEEAQSYGGTLYQSLLRLIKGVHSCFPLAAVLQDP